jgi:hypothetical protein
LRQQERERALREQNEVSPDVRMQRPEEVAPDRVPADETPCFSIRLTRREGEGAQRFGWSLKAADPAGDPATGRCLGTGGSQGLPGTIAKIEYSPGSLGDRVVAFPTRLHQYGLSNTEVLWLQMQLNGKEKK